MASTTRVGYILVDGSSYKVSRDGGQSSLTRSHQAIEPSQLSGLRVQPPFLSSETQGFEAGEGLRSRDDIATGYYGGLGVEPNDEVPTSGHLRLKVGRALTQELSQASVGGWIGTIVYANKLWLVSRSTSDLWSWDGTTFTNVTALGSTPNGTFLPSIETDRIYIGEDTWIEHWDGTTLTHFGVATGTNHRPLGTHLLVGTATPNTGYLWFSVDVVGKGRLYTYEVTGSVFTVRLERQGKTFVAGQALADTLYFWSYDAGDTRQPRAELYSVSMAAGVPAPTGLVLTDNYPTAVCVYRGELYYGMSWGGSVRKLNGDALEEILHVGDVVPPATVPGGDAIYAMAVYNDSLYVAGYDSTAPTGQRTWLRRYDGTGWHPISAGGNDLSTAILSLGVFQQTLVLGDSEVTNGRVYSLSKTSRLTSARLDTADAQYGTSGIPKRFVSVSLQHTALVAGQAVELRYVLDDGTETSVGINQDVGSTVTTFPLPTTVRGFKLRPRWYLTNVTGSDLIVAGDSVVALPAPPSREVWQADLQLAADAYDSTDTRSELDRYTALQTLQDAGAVFQVVHEYRDANGLPLLAMRAAFDPQVPLETRDLGGQAGGMMSAVAPVRLVQAASPANLLVNASFEQDAAGAAPTGWAALGTVTSALVSAAVAGQDGGKVLAITYSGSSTSGRQQSVSGLIPGRYYTASAYIRRASLTAGNVKLNVFESGIVDVSSGLAASGTTDSAFIRYAVTFLLPLTSSGTISVRLFGGSSPSGLVYWDAVQLEEGAPASTFRELGAGS